MRFQSGVLDTKPELSASTFCFCKEGEGNQCGHGRGWQRGRNANNTVDAKSKFQVPLGTWLVALSIFQKYLKTFMQLVEERCVLESEVLLYLGWLAMLAVISRWNSLVIRMPYCRNRIISVYGYSLCVGSQPDLNKKS